MAYAENITAPSTLNAPPTTRADRAAEEAKLPALPLPQIREIRLKCPLAASTIYLAAGRAPQLTIVLSDTVFADVLKAIGSRNVSNLELAGILDQAIPGLAGSMASTNKAGFAYAYSRANAEEKIRLKDAAMLLHKFWRSKGSAHRFDLKLEVVTADFDHGFTASPGASRPLADLQARLTRVESAYERRRAANPELPAVDFGVPRQLLNRAFELAAVGKRTPAIGAELGLSPTTVGSWLAGRLVLPMPTHPQGVNVSRRVATDFEFSELAAADQAYLLGAYLACHQGRTRIGRGKIELTGNHETVTKLASIIAPALKEGQTPRVLRRGRSHFCRISSIRFAEKMEELTDHGKVIPREILTTTSGALEFLRAYLGCKHTTTNSALVISKAGRPEMLVQIAGVFERLGVTPALRGTPPDSLAVVDVAGFKRLIELSAFTKKSELAAVKESARRPLAQRVYTPEDYAGVMSYLPEYKAGQVGFAEISRATGVPAATILSWIQNGKKPNIVLRQEALIAARREYGVP